MKYISLLLFILLLCGCKQQELLNHLDQQQANDVLAVLQRHNINAEKKDQGKTGFSIYVEPTDFASAVDWLKIYNLPGKPDIQISQMFPAGEFAGGMMGSELVKWVKSHKIDAHIITFVAKMPYIDSIKLLEAGAKGCVWKTSHPAKLNRAIDSISNGYTYFDSVHMDCEKISSRYSSDNQLTNRESEILQLIADGKTNKEIANFLQLSRKTVETHRLNIMKKLDVHSGIELIKTALRMGVCTI